MYNIIEATILTGSGTGEIVFILRIPIIPNKYPFDFERVQFAVNNCLKMTINKYQGQTFKAAGTNELLFTRPVICWSFSSKLI